MGRDHTVNHTTHKDDKHGKKHDEHEKKEKHWWVRLECSVMIFASARQWRKTD